MHLDFNLLPWLCWLIVATLVVNDLVTTVLIQVMKPAWIQITLVGTLLLFPLTLVHAHDVFWILFWQQSTLVIGAVVAADRTTKRTWTTFSVTTMLAATVVVSLVMAAFVGTQPSGPHQVANLFLLGWGIGVISRLQSWALHQNKFRRLAVLATVTLAFALLMSKTDLLVESLLGYGDWYESGFNDFRSWLQSHPQNSWWLTILVTAALIAFSHILIARAFAPVKQTTPKNIRKFCRIVLVANFLLIGVLPFYVFCRLAGPKAPLLVLEGPNEGRDLLVKAGEELVSSNILNANRAPNSLAEVADEIESYRRQFDQANRALLMNCHVVLPVSPNIGDYEARSSQWGPLRNVSRALSIKSRYERESGRPAMATTDAQSICQLGMELGKGGILIDSLVGMAIEAIGYRELAICTNSLPIDDLRRVVHALLQLEQQSETIEELEMRDAAWMRGAYGWIGHLPQILSEFDADKELDSAGAIRRAWKRNNFVRRSLLIAAAIGEYRQEQGMLPESLDDLVPEILSDLPLDPFADNKSFIYRRTEDTFLLYSVGPNGQDDNGKVDLENEYLFNNKQGDFTWGAYQAECIQAEAEEEPWGPPQK